MQQIQFKNKRRVIRSQTLQLFPTQRNEVLLTEICWTLVSGNGFLHVLYRQRGKLTLNYTNLTLTNMCILYLP